MASNFACRLALLGASTRGGNDLSYCSPQLRAEFARQCSQEIDCLSEVCANWKQYPWNPRTAQCHDSPNTGGGRCGPVTARPDSGLARADATMESPGSPIDEVPTATAQCWRRSSGRRQRWARLWPNLLASVCQQSPGLVCSAMLPGPAQPAGTTPVMAACGARIARGSDLQGWSQPVMGCRAPSASAWCRGGGGLARHR
jgi:hypothetical protein